jgi:hypothetical protein
VIEVTERQFRQGNQLQRPFSAAAGVSCRGVSGPLQRAATDLGADHAFRQVSMKLQEHYGITLAHETIRTITESHGRCLLEQTTLASTWPEPSGKDCILVEMDGGMVPVVLADADSPDQRKGKTLKWQELKLCIARSLDSVSRFYGGTFSGDVNEAGQHLYHCACLAGFGHASEIHSVGDGAPWIAGQVEQQFGRQGSYLVDFYHLSEYLAEAAPVCADDAKAWLRQQQAALKANRSSRVLEALLPHIEPHSEPDEKAPVRKAYRYLRNRQDQVDYAGAIEKGRPIGSGEIESAHRFVVQARLKKPGAWWKPENVDPMLALRLARLNGGWDEYWQGPKAADG